ncbi:MAG: dephospho-CoA kinase [Candidatus Omnitrophica bacterium]|nr:dephospho-CoA kinase [Candidatus Omnitrophota bacterium]
MLIGLTGTFGSGKSSVLRLFRKEGAVTISADQIVHSLLRRKIVKEAVRTIFGPAVLKQGQVNRPALAKIVFTDQEKRRKLEKLLHPMVQEKIRNNARKFSRPKKPVVVEAPLLFESGFLEPFDYIVCVSAKPDVIRFRMQKKGITAAEVESRSSSQWPISEKEKRSDAIIENSESRAKTAKQVSALMHKLIGRRLSQI